MFIDAGALLPPLRIASVSAETMKIWAPILRDPNPIHLDRVAVRSKGLGDRLINQGPINLAYVIDMLQLAFPTGMIEKLASRFVDNAYEGDALEASGRVTEIDRESNIVRVSCEFWLRAIARDLVISGNAVIAIDAGAFNHLRWP